MAVDRHDYLYHPPIRPARTLRLHHSSGRLRWIVLLSIRRRHPMNPHLGVGIVGPTVPMAVVDHPHLVLDFHLVLGFHLVLVVDSDQSLDRRYFT